LLIGVIVYGRKVDLSVAAKFKNDDSKEEAEEAEEGKASSIEGSELITQTATKTSVIKSVKTFKAFKPKTCSLNLSQKEGSEGRKE
jgi:hypothetical protein